MDLGALEVWKEINGLSNCVQETKMKDIGRVKKCALWREFESYKWEKEWP